MVTLKVMLVIAPLVGSVETLRVALKRVEALLK